MARYYFDFCAPSFSSFDDEGTVCCDMPSISEKALSALCEIASDHPQRYVGEGIRISVRNEANQIVLTAALHLSLDCAARAEHTEAA
jgi:molybdopterin-guanine dinucleotide biosynthesis protein A